MKQFRKIKPLKLKRGDKVRNSQLQLFKDINHNNRFGLLAEVKEVNTENGLVTVFYPDINQICTELISDFEKIKY